jgi:hypothetical protein
LRAQNEALLIKNLDKFYNREELPWVQLLWTKYYSNGKVPGQSMKGSFWWWSILKLLTTFKGIAEAEAGSWSTILFWKDVWNWRIMEISIRIYILLQSLKIYLCKVCCPWSHFMIYLICPCLRKPITNIVSSKFYCKRWMMQRGETSGSISGVLVTIHHPRPTNICQVLQ